MIEDNIRHELVEMRAQMSIVVDGQKDTGEKLDTLCEIMNGNGTPDKGLVVRFDRMEQWWLDYTKKKTKIALAALTAGVSLVGSLSLLVIRLVWGI